MMFLLKLLLVGVLIFLNGFFVATEYALVSVRRTRILELVKRGHGKARLVLAALNNLEDSISATQLGITLSGLALGWLGESTIAVFLEPLFSFLPQEEASLTAHGVSTIIAFILITFMLIVFGELIPKRVALQKTEGILMRIIIPLTFFSRLFRPFIWVLQNSSAAVAQLFGLATHTKGKRSPHSEEEVKIILAQSAEHGTLEKEEVKMMSRVLKLADVLARDIMTSKAKIKAVPDDIPIGELKKVALRDGRSRHPVYKNSVNTIIGYIHERDIHRLELEKIPLLSESRILRKVIYVPERKHIDDILIEMRRKQIHIAVVINRKKQTVGLVTLEDILEIVVGEIYDEFDKNEEDTL